MNRCESNCDICKSILKEWKGKYIFIKFKCPDYFGTAGKVLDVRDNLLIIRYVYGGISITCCDNICYAYPINWPDSR